MLTVTFNRKDLEVRDSNRNRTAHVIPAAFVRLGGYAERLAAEAMQNPMIPVPVPHKIRTSWRRIW